MAGDPSVHGIHVGQDVAQPRVGDIAGDQLVGRQQELLGVGEDRPLRFAQAEHADLVRQAVERLDIAPYTVGLGGEPDGEALCETLPARRDG